MFSNRATPLDLAIVSLATLLVLTVSACGRKESPEPPPSKNPARTNDLEVSQRGSELILVMSYPSVTEGGLALPGIDRVEIERYSRPAPEFMEAPKEPEDAATTEGVAETPTAEAQVEPAEAPVAEEPVGEEPAEAEVISEDLPIEDDDQEGSAEEGELEEVEPNPFLQIRLDPEEFRKQAEVALVLEGPELEASVVGGMIEVRLALPEIPTEPPIAYTFQATTFSGRLRSRASNFKSFVPLPPPPPPTGLTTTPERSGIEISWDALENDAEVEVEGINIYRRLRGSSLYPPPLTTLESTPTLYLDSSAQFGISYVYAVSVVRMKLPLVESPVAESDTLTYSDDFAPQPPQGLVVLAEVGRIRLVWDASREGDVVGYLVFVAQDGGDATQLTPEPVQAAEFIHQGTVSGTAYAYTVYAVDSTGNRSEPSEEAKTRAP